MSTPLNPKYHWAATVICSNEILPINKVIGVWTNLDEREKASKKEKQRCKLACFRYKYFRMEDEAIIHKSYGQN